MGITIPSRTSLLLGHYPHPISHPPRLIFGLPSIPLEYCMAYQNRRISMIPLDGMSIYYHNQFETIRMKRASEMTGQSKCVGHRNHRHRRVRVR